MITSGMCYSFKAELLRGIHDLSTDVVKAALYTYVANLGPQTTAYSATNEVSGSGYTAGGVALAVSSGYPRLDPQSSRFGVVAFDVFTQSPFTVTFRGILLYNSSKANRAIMVLDQGVDVVLADGRLTLRNNPYNPYPVVIA